MADETRRLLNGYIGYLKRQRQGEKEPGSSLAIHEIRVEYIVNEFDLDDPDPH